MVKEKSNCMVKIAKIPHSEIHSRNSTININTRNNILMCFFFFCFVNEKTACWIVRNSLTLIISHSTLAHLYVFSVCCCTPHAPLPAFRTNNIVLRWNYGRSHSRFAFNYNIVWFVFFSLFSFGCFAMQKVKTFQTKNILYHQIYIIHFRPYMERAFFIQIFIL